LRHYAIPALEYFSDAPWIPPHLSTPLQEQVQATTAWIKTLRDAIGHVIVGQEQLVGRLLVGLLANGHVLLEQGEIGGGATSFAAGLVGGAPQAGLRKLTDASAKRHAALEADNGVATGWQQVGSLVLAAITPDFVLSGKSTIDFAGKQYAAQAMLEPPFDPKNERIMV